MRFQWATFHELSGQDVYKILQARSAVFVVEQTCPFQDMDNLDSDSYHLILWEEDQIAAYLRVLPPGLYFDEASVGRVLSTPNFRNRGLGKELLAEGLRRLESHFPGTAVRINAQSYLRRFYESFGFVVSSDEFLEDDIPHLEMLRNGA